MTIDVHIEPTVLSPTDLAALDTQQFYAHVGDINTAFAAAETAFRAAQDNLLVLLTEQVARHCLTIHPAAALLFVRVAAKFHYDESGEQSPTCEGHDPRLVPFEIYNEDGTLLSGFEPLSPVFYLLERITGLLDTEDQVLDIAAREWAYDCTND